MKCCDRVSSLINLAGRSPARNVEEPLFFPQPSTLNPRPFSPARGRADFGAFMHPSLDDLLKRLLAFRDERDWAQFQTPKNLALSISLEAAELLEHFQWTTEDEPLSQKRIQAMSEEVADILIYLLLMADRLGIDPVRAARDKIEKNEARYPAELVRGKSTKQM